MSLPDGSPDNPGADELQFTRETDYGHDVSDVESRPVPTGYDPDTPARMKRLITIIGSVLVVGFLIVLGLRLWDAHRLAQETREAENAVRTVDTIVIGVGGTPGSLTLPGQATAWFATTIYGRVSGFVASWQGDIGDRVHKGQTLATIDTPELDAELAAARAQLQAAQADQVARASDAEFARSTNARWRDSPEGVVSDQERDAKLADYNAAVARLKAAQAQVSLQQARVAQFEALARFKQVVAPFDGVISERRIDIGNLVTAGSTSATTPMYQLTQNNPIRVSVDVPQSAAAAVLKPGQVAEVLADVPERISMPVKVSRAAGALNAQARTLRLELDVPNPDGRLLPGMAVKVAFHLDASGLVQVPAAALVFRGSGPEVLSVDPHGRVTFRAVTIARDDGRVVELASGAAAGDRLVLNPSSQLRDNDLVQVRPDNAAAEAKR